MNNFTGWSVEPGRVTRKYRHSLCRIGGPNHTRIILELFVWFDLLDWILVPMILQMQSAGIDDHSLTPGSKIINQRKPCPKLDMELLWICDQKSVLHCAISLSWQNSHNGSGLTTEYKSKHWPTTLNSSCFQNCSCNRCILRTVRKIIIFF